MLRLSPSTLGLFKECPRCFWLEKVHRLKVPRGIFPSLPGGMDRCLKAHYDLARSAGKLPPELIGKVEGWLFRNQQRLNQWRDWKQSDLTYRDPHGRFVISGAIDDLIVQTVTSEASPEGIEYYAPLDYKTRGSACPEHPKIYYQDQLNCYGLLLQAAGLSIAPQAWLASYYPIRAGVLLEPLPVGGAIETIFQVEVFQVDISLVQVVSLAIAAWECVQGELPTPGESCERCAWLQTHVNLVRLIKRAQRRDGDVPVGPEQHLG